MSVQNPNPDGLILRNDFPSSTAYQATIDAALGAELEGFHREELSSDLIVYEKSDERITRMIFLNTEKMDVYITFMFDPFDSDNEAPSNEALLYLNFSLLYAKFGKDLDEQMDLSYAFAVEDFFSVLHFRTYLNHMEKTLQRILV